MLSRDGSVSAYDEAADAQFIVYTEVPLRWRQQVRQTLSLGDMAHLVPVIDMDAKAFADTSCVRRCSFQACSISASTEACKHLECQRLIQPHPAKRIERHSRYQGLTKEVRVAS